MRLPNGDRAFINERKLADYCLSPTHPVGRHKAVVIASALGFGPQDADKLRHLLLRAVGACDALPVQADAYGQRYQLDLALTSLRGKTVTLRSVWLVRPGEDFPRLVTCYVLTKE